MAIRIDRFNGNTLRRYHLKSRAIVIVNSTRRCAVIPASMMAGFIVPIDRGTALELLLNDRNT